MADSETATLPSPSPHPISLVLVANSSVKLAFYSPFPVQLCLLEELETSVPTCFFLTHTLDLPCLEGCSLEAWRVSVLSPDSENMMHGHLSLQMAF